MDHNNSINSIQDIRSALEEDKGLFILLPQNPGFDATAAGLAFYLSLKQAQKNVFIGSPFKMRVEYKSLVGVDRISNEVGNRNLIISFDYAEESIEKVSYNVEDSKFNLVVEPKSGHPPLDTKGVEFKYQGIDTQIMFVVGAKKLQDLGDLYQENRGAFNQTTIVNLDNSTTNTKFGQINLVDPKISSICEATFSLLVELKLPVNQDAANNLLKGIEAKTQNLQAPFASPETFETVAHLLRAGAKRSPSAPQPSISWPSRASQASSLNIAQRPAPSASPQPPAGYQPPLTQQTQQSVKSQTPRSQTPTPSKANENQSRRKPASNQDSDNGQENDQKPKPDWYKPKILKGSSEV